MKTIFRCDRDLAEHLLQYGEITRHSANAVEFETALVGSVNEAVQDFYSKRSRNGTIRRSHPRRDGVVINTQEQLMAALTRT